MRTHYQEYQYLRDLGGQDGMQKLILFHQDFSLKKPALLPRPLWFVSGDLSV
jgi:hypothetical protein